MRRPLVALLALTATAALLAGCVTVSPPSTDPGTTRDPESDPPASAETTPTDAPSSDTVDFDAALPTGSTVEWTDSMFADDDFTVDSPDDGGGRWSYTQVSSGCTISFWQATTEGFGTAGDERERSDLLLAEYLGADVAEVQQYVYDTPVAIADAFGGGGFETRAVVGGGSEDDWITLARVFDGPDQGLAVDVTCPAGTNAEEQLASLMPDFVAARVG